MYCPKCHAEFREGGEMMTRYTKMCPSITLSFIFTALVLTLTIFLQTVLADIKCREVMSAAEEKDNIFTLLAYAVVLKDWQNNDMEHNRGYNIGSVLVDQNNKAVYWARNSVNLTKNMSQHGEVRLMTCYLWREKTKNLKGYTIYTTLEPCAMCSGMMMLTSMPRTVYGETDPGYGMAIERLELDSRKLPNGYAPYLRHVTSIPSIAELRCALDDAYDNYGKSHPQPHITEFLTTDEAKKIYSFALNTLMNYRVKYPENQAVVDQAQAFYRTVPDKNVPCCAEGCP
jgi:tRNA(adenine34) deaminase